MNGRLLRRVGLAALAAWAIHGSAGADLIVLRNGQELRGRVRTKGDEVRIDLDIGGTVTVARGDIARTVAEAPASATAAATLVPAELLERLERRERLHRLLAQLSADKASTRDAAERELAAAGRSALPLLRPALADGTGVELPHLLRILSAIGDPATLPRIRALLRDPKHKGLHVEAARALAEIGGPRVAPELTVLLVNAQDDEVGALCLKALAWMRSPFAAPFVVEALQRPALRASARSAIARWGDPILLPYLRLLLRKAPAEARPRVAAWVADLITPGHVAFYSALLDAYEDDKDVAKALKTGAQRLHEAFPTIGDVALLSASQVSVRDKAHELLKRRYMASGRPADPRAWKAEAERATAPRILLVAVGTTNRQVLKDLAAALATALSRPVEVGERHRSPAGPADRPRDVRRLHVSLDRRQREDYRSVRVIGVASVDVTAPGRAYALAPTGRGRSVVLSLARLGKTRGRTAQAARLALHALAGSLGIGPCSAAGCPSGPVYQASDVAAKGSRYCPACLKALAAAWDSAAVVARFDYAAAAARLSRQAGRSDKGLRAAAACMHERAMSPAAARKEWDAYLALERDEAVKALVERRMALLDQVAPKRAKGKNPGP